MKQIKQIALAILFCCFAMVAQAQNKNTSTVEVIVFHGAKQCQTCLAIKKHAAEVVSELAKKLPANEKVVYKVIDTTKPENKKIAEKYEIAWTSLLLIKHDNTGKETVNNISEFAIQTARTNTAEFKKVLEQDIRNMFNSK